MEEKSLPILFIVFNRPDTAIRSFKSIREFKPKYLYIACDGPRPNYPKDIELVEKTKDEIINSIDWNCEVKTLFHESNLGCGLGVYTAINWFFSEVEYGVILEDDCIAEFSFFKYAYQVLEKFKNDNRIGMISGTNPIKNFKCAYPYSIVYSVYKSCWGWGTWKRAWENMDIEMSWRSKSQELDILKNCGYCGKDFKVWKYKLKCIDQGVVSAWDWQWYFSLGTQNQLCIFPVVNQISNIGDDENATHTSFSKITISSSSLSFPLKYPPYIVPNRLFDEEFYSISNSFFFKFIRLFSPKSKMKIKDLLGKWLK